MQPLYNYEAPKKTTNLSVNSDLLRMCRELDINLSAALEQALNEKLIKNKAEKWREENKMAIQSYNNFIDKYGCFGEEYREF